VIKCSMLVLFIMHAATHETNLKNSNSICAVNSHNQNIETQHIENFSCSKLCQNLLSFKIYCSFWLIDFQWVYDRWRQVAYHSLHALCIRS